MLERGRGERRALEAAVAEEVTFEAERGQPRQHRQDARAVVRVGRSQFEVEQRAVLVADCEELHTLDQFAAIDAAYPGGRGRAERTAVGHHRRGQHLVAGGQPPIVSTPVETWFFRISRVAGRRSGPE